MGDQLGLELGSSALPAACQVADVEPVADEPATDEPTPASEGASKVPGVPDDVKAVCGMCRQMQTLTGTKKGQKTGFCLREFGKQVNESDEVCDDPDIDPERVDELRSKYRRAASYSRSAPAKPTPPPDPDVKIAVRIDPEQVAPDDQITIVVGLEGQVPAVWRVATLNELGPAVTAAWTQYQAQADAGATNDNDNNEEGTS